MSWLYHIVTKTFWLVFKLFYRLEVHGRNHIKKGGGLIVANHVSFWDPPAIAVSIREEIHFLARKSLFKGFFSWFLPKVNVHPVDPKMNNLQVIKDICKLIKEGKKVLIFPEGTRSLDGELQSLQTGVGLILSRTQSMFIPAYIHGLHDIWSRDKKRPKAFGRVKVVFGPTIEWDKLDGPDSRSKQKLAMSELEKAMKALQSKA